MTTFNVEFDCNNAAFDGRFGDEINFILKRVTQRVADGETEGTIYDSNGNTIGAFILKDDDA